MNKEFFQVVFRRPTDKLLTQGSFMYNNGKITLSKYKSVLFRTLRNQETVMEFTENDIAECRNGEIKGYTSVRFILTSGEMIDVSLTKNVAEYFLQTKHK
ncbi:MAG: hypothetical protein IJD49_08965 [Clostridia bacterium]|nr:hypothetical protein [Clostridia bacterium]